MLKKELDNKRKLLKDIQERMDEFVKRELDLEKAIEEAHIKNNPDDLEWKSAWKQIYDTKKREMVVNTYV